VGIAGEVGIGKSRLVLEFRRALARASEAVTWLEGHGLSCGQASPFLPLIEPRRENFQIDALDGEPQIIAKAEQDSGCGREAAWRHHDRTRWRRSTTVGRRRSLWPCMRMKLGGR
jgi:hypothetical protein